MAMPPNTPYALRKILRYREMPHDELITCLLNRTQSVLEENVADKVFEYVVDADNAQLNRVVLLLLDARIHSASLIMSLVDVLVAVSDEDLESANQRYQQAYSQLNSEDSLFVIAALVAASISDDQAENTHLLNTLMTTDHELDKLRESQSIQHERVMIHVGLKAAIHMIQQADDTTTS